MNSSNLNDNEENSAIPSREEIQSAQFANMVMQQTNMALMFLGKVPHPQTHETVTDLGAAQMFIDQLEMLENKTKGNLNKQEDNLLKQSLMALRLAFVDEIEKGGQSEKPAAAPTTSQGQGTTEAPAASSQIESGPAADESESRKKFSKKY